MQQVALENVQSDGLSTDLSGNFVANQVRNNIAAKR